MRDDSNKAEATTAFKGNLILFCYHIKRREVLTFQPTTGLLHKHFELCFSIMQLCIPLIHMCIFHQILSSPETPSSPSSCLGQADTESNLTDFSLAKETAGWGEEARGAWSCQQGHFGHGWDGGMLLHSSPCNLQEWLRISCWHLRQRCSSTHRVRAVIHCWRGMAIQSTEDIMLVEMWNPYGRSSQPFWFQLLFERLSLGPVWVAQCTGHWLLSNNISKR